MPTLNFDHADAAEMQNIQRVITAAIIPFRTRIEAAIVVFALVRCARILIRLYPTPFQRQLVALLCDYLENEETPPGDTSPIWMPETIN